MFRRVRARLIPVVLISVFVLVASACGTSADEVDDSSGSGAGDASDSVGVTESDILFGMATPTTGNASSLGIDGQKGAEVFIKWLNDQGGTNGRDWKLTVQDDGFDPTKKVAAVQYLTNQQKVFAIWGDVGSLAGVAIPAAEESGTPYLFPYSLEQVVYDPVKPRVFAHIPSSEIQERANGNWIKANYPGSSTDPKFGLLTLNDPAGQLTAKGFKDSDAGDWVVAEQTFERTATSWKPQLEALKSDGVTDVVLHASDAWTAKIVTEAKEIAMNANFWASSGAVSAGAFKLAGDALEGTHAVSILGAPDDASQPGIKEFLDAFAKYEPGYTPGTFALNSWAGGLIIAEAMKAIEGDPTRSKLVDALNDLKDFDTGGVTGNISFSEDDHLGSDQVVILEATGGHWVPVSDWVNEKTASE